MEDTLRVNVLLLVIHVLLGLNPYSNGRYSERRGLLREGTCFRVLILILMEDTLREI